MAKILTIIAMALVSGNCFAQPNQPRHSPLKYALVDGESQPSGSIKNEARYQKYVKEVVLSYKSILHLSKTQEIILSSALTNYYSPLGIRADQIHFYIEWRMKRILKDPQYLIWKSLKSYPEYNLFTPTSVLLD